MSRGQRLALLGVAAVIAIVAFVLIRPGAGERQTAPPGSPEEPASSRGGGERATREGRKSAPPPPTIRLRGGRPVGGVEELTVRSGDRVRFRVISDQAAEIHVHGYDRTVNLPAGRPTTVSFPASVEGVFEIESHDTGAEIASLKVVP